MISDDQKVLANFIEEGTLPYSSVPERRLLASVLQRAMIDFLSMDDKEGRLLEVATGFMEESDEQLSLAKFYDEGEEKPVGPRKADDGREDRNLIRWFRSESKHFCSFLHITEALGLENIRGEIFRILNTETIEDRPHLSGQI